MSEKEKASISMNAIEKVLDEKVRPDLALHGGDISVTQLKDGVLSVRLLGQCSNCPSAMYTMESMVKEELMEAFPGLSSVELVTGVSDDLIAQARKILRERQRS